MQANYKKLWKLLRHGNQQLDVVFLHVFEKVPCKISVAAEHILVGLAIGYDCIPLPREKPGVLRGLTPKFDQNLN